MSTKFHFIRVKFLEITAFKKKHPKKIQNTADLVLNADYQNKTDVLPSASTTVSVEPRKELVDDVVDEAHRHLRPT